MIDKSVLLSCLGFLACETQESPEEPVDRSVVTETVLQQEKLPTSTQEKQSLHAGFGALLRKHVREERVDYLRLRDDDLPELEEYLQKLARVDLSDLSPSESLALYINLYNATMIREVCQNLRAGYSSAQDEFALFDAVIVEQGEEKFSLNHLENEIIRNQFDEPRIHVALVCGARSCPPLIERAYEAEDLEAVLEANMKRFVSDPFRNRVSVDRLSLSKLFEWYVDDFGGNEKLRKYLAAYSKVDTSKAKIDYLEYYWELNMAAPATGRWVQVEKAGGGLEKGDMVEVLDEEGGELILRLPFAKGETRLAADQVKALADS